MISALILAATLAQNAVAITNAAAQIDAAIVAKGGSTAGGLTNAPAAIAALPSGGSDNIWSGWKNDGNTHVWVTTTEDTKNTALSFKYEVLGGRLVTIDWGDGNSEHLIPVNWRNISHTYGQVGSFHIVISDDVNYSTPSIRCEGYNASTPYKGVAITEFERGSNMCRYFTLPSTLRRIRINKMTGESPWSFFPDKGTSLNNTMYSLIELDCTDSLVYIWQISTRGMTSTYNFAGALYNRTYSPTSGQDFSNDLGVNVINMTSIDALSPWMFYYCSNLKVIYIDSITKVWPDGGTSFTDRHPFLGCTALTDVYVRNRTCAETMAMGVFPWGYPGTTAVWHCSDGKIKNIDGTWTIVTE